MPCPYCGLNYMPAQHKCPALDPEWQSFDMVCPTCKMPWAGVERVLAERNHLRAEVARLTRELGEARRELEIATRDRSEEARRVDTANARTFAEVRQRLLDSVADRDALRALLGQLVAALHACEPRRHSDFCIAENHPGLPCSCAYEVARAALAAAAPYLP